MTTDRNSEAVTCDHCGAPCREEVLMRGGENGWGDDKSRTVKRYTLERVRKHTPPATIPVADVQALVERLGQREVACGEAGKEWEAAIYRELADELAALIPRNPE